ncbi:hypothetical protein E4P35_11015 [Thiopseudomonas sp. 4R-3cl]|nr:hypothetical protein E4P35_11015 [Thiopseudomonas sp. 4R-3cl]
MVDLILNGILPYKEVRFLKPPKGTYAVYFDDIDYYGADDLIKIKRHTVRIEVYGEKIDREIENQIEARMINLKLEFNKGERTWLNDIQSYMLAYYLEYTEKTGG